MRSPDGRRRREAEGWSRRIADVADRGLGRLNWADSGRLRRATPLTMRKAASAAPLQSNPFPARGFPGHSNLNAWARTRTRAGPETIRPLIVLLVLINPDPCTASARLEALDDIQGQPEPDMDLGRELGRDHLAPAIPQKAEAREAEQQHCPSRRFGYWGGGYWGEYGIAEDRDDCTLIEKVGEASRVQC